MIKNAPHRLERLNWHAESNAGDFLLPYATIVQAADCFRPIRTVLFATQVELAATVFVAEGKPPRTVNIRITHPNTCSLKYDEVDLNLRQMLEASGIEPQALAPVAVEESGASQAAAG